MKLVIETARNGYVIRDQNDGSEPEVLTTIGENDPVDATSVLLGEVLELIGHIGSRYDERRVRVTIEPGDKWQPLEGTACLHERIERWSHDGETRWTCRCGAAFGPVASDAPVVADH